MLKRIFNSCAPRSIYPNFRVTFGNKPMILTIEYEYLKISKHRIYYGDILKFGHKRTYFYFFTDERSYMILKTSKSRQISELVHSRCLDLLEDEYEISSRPSDPDGTIDFDRPPDYSSGEDDEYQHTFIIENPLVPRQILEN